MNCIVRISAAVCGALLLAGCYKPDGPASEQNGICFEAGSMLLRDDAETKGTKETFGINDNFTVFGERVTSADVHSLVFDGVTVTKRAAAWEYSTLRFWYWVSQSDRYDFVAVSPADLGSSNEHALGNLSVSTPYNYDNPSGSAPSGGNQQDILAATYRRTGNDWAGRYNRVDLSFSHMGSAVSVKIVNNSTSANVTLNYLQFQNLVVSANAKVSLDNYGRSVLRWANPTPSSAYVRKLSPQIVVTPGGHDWTSDFQIMIPQSLTLYAPKLWLNYTVGETTKTTDIPLNGIERADGTAINSWEIGYKYTYIISMRVDGGLLVTVTTTPWDEPVQGETPGILI